MRWRIIPATGRDLPWSGCPCVLDREGGIRRAMNADGREYGSRALDKRRGTAACLSVPPGLSSRIRIFGPRRLRPGLSPPSFTAIPICPAVKRNAGKSRAGRMRWRIIPATDRDLPWSGCPCVLDREGGIRRAMNADGREYESRAFGDIRMLRRDCCPPRPPSWMPRIARRVRPGPGRSIPDSAWNSSEFRRLSGCPAPPGPPRRRRSRPRRLP